MTRPTLPAARSGRCPYDPAPDQVSWLTEPGLPPVFWRDLPVHAVNRFDDVRDAMAHPHVSSQVRGSDIGRAFGDYEDLPASFAQRNDPEHARVRRMMQREFTVKHVRALRPELQAIADELLDRLVADGPEADLVTAYALPIPSRAICLILGVPYATTPSSRSAAPPGSRSTRAPTSGSARRSRCSSSCST